MKKTLCIAGAILLFLTGCNPTSKTKADDISTFEEFQEKSEQFVNEAKEKDEMSYSYEADYNGDKITNTFDFTKDTTNISISEGDEVTRSLSCDYGKEEYTVSDESDPEGDAAVYCEQVKSAEDDIMSTTVGGEANQFYEYFVKSEEMKSESKVYTEDGYYVLEIKTDAEGYENTTKTFKIAADMSEYISITEQDDKVQETQKVTVK